MIIFRRRLVYWLIKEYVKKSGRIILFSFLIGLSVFFLLRYIFASYVSKISIGTPESIGIVGAYTLENLPQTIVRELSHGLTVETADQSVKADLATKWRIQDDGKTYLFVLREDAYFSDGTNVTSEHINYNFSDAKVIRPGKYTLVYKLKDNFSPFLTSITRPVFKNGLVGVSTYKITNVKLNGTFVQSLTLTSIKGKYQTKTYQFYPNSQALKTAYMLGEVNIALGLSDPTYNGRSFSSFSNTTVQKRTNTSRMVTLFYNTTDAAMSDKRLRNALAYAIPEHFVQGSRNSLPYPPVSWAYGSQYATVQDLEHTKLLLTDIQGKDTKEITVDLKTLSKYKPVAQEIAKSWKEAGIKTNIQTTESIPEKFQVFLGDFNMPKDPDQYSLWHSNQDNNITHYDNKRIDKLLEDGRKVGDRQERKKIYLDFQKYLLADAPASFLFFPYEYDIIRK